VSPLSAALTKGALPVVMGDCYARRRSGVLLIRQPAGERRFRFRQGELVGLESSLVEEGAAEHLIRHSQASQADLAQAAALQERGLSLGRALEELGILEPGRAQQLHAERVRALARAVVAAGAGEWSFEDSDLTDAWATDELPPTGDLILELARSVDEPETVHLALGDRERLLGLATDARFAKLRLSPTEGFLLSRIDGTLSAHEVAQMLPLPAGERERALLALLAVGAIHFVERPVRKPSRAMPTVSAPPAPAPSPELMARRDEIEKAFAGLKGASHFDVLGLPKASSAEKVKEAYFRFAKRFHPDAVRKQEALADLFGKAEAVFIRIGEAYEVLRDPRRRGMYEADLAARTPRLTPGPPPAAAPVPAPADPEADARAVEQAITQGERFIAEEKFWDAIQALEAALPLAEGKASLRLRVLLSKALLKNPHWVKRAEELLLTVIKDEPSHFGGHYLLGNIYKQGGLRARATHMLQRAVELDPTHEEAREALAELGPAPGPDTKQETPPQGGLLKRLFGKN